MVQCFNEYIATYPKPLTNVRSIVNITEFFTKSHDYKIIVEKIIEYRTQIKAKCVYKY